MKQDIDIGGRSRGFRIVVLFVAVGVVLSAMMIVGGISDSEDIGVSVDPENGDGDGDLFSSEFITSGDGTGDGRYSTYSGDPGGDIDYGMRDSLNAEERLDELFINDEQSLVDDQSSVNSHRSFILDKHFTVDTDMPGYWRVTTQDVYTADGFISDSTESPESMRLLPKSDVVTSGMQSDLFTLEQEASRLPSRGTPQSIEIVSGVDDDKYIFRVSPDGTIIVTDPGGNIDSLPPGTVYRLQSTDPEKGAENSVSGDGSDSPYLHVPDSQGDRVEGVASDVIRESGAETNKQKANAIATWLQINNEYKANATHDPDENIVEQFLFEMGGGHSTYFTTSTTAMLRSQGVPARVGVGYTEGYQNENGTHDVGSMEQHTWVEVYTGGGEWEIIDAAPTDDKESVQWDVMHGDFTATEYGVERSVIQRWANEKEEYGGNGSETEWDGVGDLTPPYDIVVEPEPTPGAEVTVLVAKNDTAVSDAGVEFNGDVVGETNESGVLTAQVPYSDSLTVTVTPPGEMTTMKTRASTGHSVSGGGGVLGSTVAQSGQMNSSETYSLPTDVSVTSDSVNVPGSEITATFTINGTPVPGVDVYISDERVGKTGTDGEITMQIPDDVALGETVTVRVERDELVSTTSIDIAEGEVRVDTGMVAYPGKTVDVTVVATNNGMEKPVPNATISVYTGGTVEGDMYAEEITVAENGTATIDLPWSNELTVTASLYNTEKTTTVTGIYYPLLGVSVLGLSLLFTTVIIGRRRGVITHLRHRENWKVTMGDVKTWFYGVLFAFGARLRDIGSRISSLTSRILRGVQTFVQRRWGEITALDVRAFTVGVLMVPMSLLVWLYVLLQDATAFLKQQFTGRSRDTVSENPPSIDDAVNGDSGDGDVSSYDRVRRCWRWLVRLVIGRTTRNTKTAVEIGEKAIASGFPSGPVTRLRITFQEVRYGSRDADERVGDAETAVDNLQESGEDGSTTTSVSMTEES